MKRNLTQTTLSMDPETQWQLQREMIGQSLTLPVAESAQAALRRLRDEVVAEVYARVTEAEVDAWFEVSP